LALSPSQRDREYNNFADNGDGTTSRYMQVTGGLGTILSGVTYDYILATYPTSSSEVYTFKLGGSGGTTVATVTVQYTSASKQVLTSVTRT